MNCNRFFSAVVGVTCLVGAMTAQANLIVNGSFEVPDLGSGWGLYSTISGWTTPEGGYPIEIGAGSVYGVTGYDGDQVMEMDSTGNVIVDQIMASTVGSYTLSFLYAQRAGVSPSSGSFDVSWNGSLINSFAPNSTAMALYSTTVNVLAGNNILELRGTGAQDTYGALVDNFKLENKHVPDGGTTLALLGVGVLGLAALRRKLSL